MAKLDSKIGAEGIVLNMNDRIVKETCSKYGIEVISIVNFIDSSHGEEDIRYNYIVNHAYVLKMNMAAMITEEFLTGMNALVNRYRSIDVWCPQLLKNDEGQLLTVVSFEGKTYRCYVEECAPYQFSHDEDMYILKREMIGHVGKLASLYSDIDLADHYSMWSIIDLNPMDTDVDEKQENLNDLISVLKDNGYHELAETLAMKNMLARQRIQKDYKKLPRCVYQGDLNPSNLLVDDNNNFVGLIDFNMFGTEVNINCFINEAMYYMEKEDFELSPDEIIDKANHIQKELLDKILQHYTMNDLEKELFRYYKFVTDISFYPNVQLWMFFLNNHINENKVIALIKKMLS